ncbi:MAG: phospholipid/cholesterol/gamma-HCH transport system substrate-binding protein [Thermoleophilaceae bacterium]|jgi:virulence factor Mce-like protein|nr:phospholipid/cholesterol/gamma-HCH transport system substrate-binding protein [Thermoleophilaceae bacterium]
MTRGRSTASIVASPVLVGAVTVLIVVVSVFLAYNANSGLPFVPTYNLRAELPGGANLVPGNEVRIGGFRVGVIDKIGAGTGVFNGRRRAIAIVRMKIDKSAAPLSRDTQVLVRPRSALGLKFIQLTPGTARASFRDGETIPLKAATAPVEFDDFLNTFDRNTRQNSQDALTGFGDAFAGRGTDVNNAIQGLAPFFRYLTPVMANLSNPRTQLKEFFKQIGRASAQVAPVARIQAQVFSEMADTFAAIGHDANALRATIEKNPPTLDTAIESFRVQRPFLADFTDLSARLRPAARELVIALPKLNSALRIGTPVSRRSPILNDNTANVLNALDDLVRDPNTLLGLKDLTTLTKVAAPFATYIAPYQSVCNYGALFLNGLGSHISEGTKNGTAERVLVKLGDSQQNDAAPDTFAARPSDVPPNVSSHGTMSTGNNPKPLVKLMGQPYTAAIDAQGNANCAKGQFGYPDGPLLDTKGRYPSVPGQRDSDGTYNTWQAEHGGGGHVVNANYPPFLYGPNFTGLKSLSQVDSQLKKDGVDR